MKTSNLVSHLAELKKWATPEYGGRARASAVISIEAYKKAFPTLPVGFFPFGDEGGSVHADGTAFNIRAATRRLRQLSDVSEPTPPEVGEISSLEQEISSLEQALDAANHLGWVPGIKPGDIPVGSVPTNKMIGNIRIPCGLVIILGGGGVGKTPIAHALAGAGDREYEVIRYGEPLSGYCHDPREAATRVASALLSHGDVVLDSVKDVMALAGGAAMKSGIMRSVLPMFTQWSTMAADVGSTLYVPVNPSSDDVEVISLMEEAAKSNSTSLILAQGPNAWKYVMRQGEGLIRTSGDFATSYLDSGVLEIQSKMGSVTNKNRILTGTITDEQLSQAVRRTLNASPL